MTLSVVALITWLATAGAGLYLLSVWLIEYDREYQTTAATRLPVPVLGTHALLAISGIVVWSAYLLLDNVVLAWAAVIILVCVATLGMTMVARWMGTYRAVRQRSRAAALSTAPAAAPAVVPAAVPPERHFPVPVVIGHGLLASVTIVLVLLTALRVGGS